MKGGELGTEFILKERILFHYDKDSITGETHFAYLLQGRKKGIDYQRRKTLYQYFPHNKKRQSKQEYDFDGQLRVERNYHYDKNGRLQFTMDWYPKDGNKYFTEYKYKEGKIWQIIEQIDHKKSVKIFNKGRLVRLRTYFSDRIFSITDYQYIYYN